LSTEPAQGTTPLRQLMNGMSLLTPQERLIFALDVPDKDTAREYVHELRDEVGLFKVGLQLFLAEGPGLLEDLANILGPQRIFLDLKLYDIPATVLGAISTVVPGVALVTVPSDLGPTGLEKIVGGTTFTVLAVTVLTSMTGEDLLALGYEPHYAQDPTRLVVRRARMSQEAGCHGVVCSGREVKAVKEACRRDFLAVCPGIRPTWAAVPGDDQKRIVTPYEAVANGADYIVVGRPISRASDRKAAARRVVEEIAAAMPG
jgi:orotidine-5'-phosphate decarboxylase